MTNGQMWFGMRRLGTGEWQDLHTAPAQSAAEAKDWVQTVIDGEAREVGHSKQHALEWNDESDTSTAHDGDFEYRVISWENIAKQSK